MENSSTTHRTLEIDFRFRVIRYQLRAPVRIQHHFLFAHQRLTCNEPLCQWRKYRIDLQIWAASLLRQASDRNGAASSLRLHVQANSTATMTHMSSSTTVADRRFVFTYHRPGPRNPAL